MDTLTTLQQLVEATAYRSPKQLPQSADLSFLSKQSGTTQLWKWSNNEVSQLTNLNEMVTNVWHIPTSSLSIVGIDHQGNEKQQLLLFNRDTGDLEELIFNPAYVHYYGCCSVDQKRVVWTSNRLQEHTFDLYMQYVASKEFELIYQFDSVCIPLYWFPNEERVLVSVEVSNIDNELYIVDVENKIAKKVMPHSSFARYQSIQVTKDGQGIYVVTDAHADKMGLYHFHFKTARWQAIVQDDYWDIEQAVLSPDESTIAYTMNENGYSSLHSVNLQTLQTSVAQFPMDGVIESIIWTSNDKIVFGYENPIQPSTLQAYTFQTNSTVALLQHEGVVASLPELRHYSSFDGKAIPYFYYQNNTKNCPTILYIHGGPEAQYRPSFDPGLQYLHRLGYKIAAPNIRGSLGYGRSYIKQDDEMKRLDALQDIIALANHLVKTGDANPKNLIIMGHSYGGFSTLLALTHYPDMWQAGIDIMGMSNLNTFFERVSSWRKKLRQYEYGDLTTHAAFFEEIAPLNRVDSIKAPLLVVHGSFDARVPLAESTQLIEQMNVNNQPVDYVHFDDEGHFMEKLKNSTILYEEIAQFLQKFAPTQN